MNENSARKSFCCVISPKSRPNYEICRRLGLWGFTKSAQRMAARVQPGDLLWFYIGGRGFVSLARAMGVAEPFGPDERAPWQDGRTYGSRLRIAFLFDLREPIRPNFPHVFGGFKRDPELGLHSNQLMGGFFEMDAALHERLLTRGGDQIPRGWDQQTFEPLKDYVGFKVANDVRESSVSPSPADIASLGQDEPIAMETQGEDQAIEVIVDHGHVKAQWQLARMGRSLGLEVWVPKADRHRAYQNQPLGELSVAYLPNFGLPPDARQTVENIDVLWIDHGTVVCAFEIEHSTSVYSGLLRLADLVTVQPYTRINLFIVASTSRKGKVRKELMRPTFESLKSPLTKICRFLSYEELETQLPFAERHGQHLKFSWVDDLAESFTDSN